MHCTVVDFASDRTVYNITGCTKEELDNKLNLFFSSEGYKIKSDSPEYKVYKKGNRTLRILFGAFAKFYQTAVAIKSQNDFFSVQVSRDSTGFSGGLIGMKQVRKEFERQTEAFKTFFSK
jgi:hypothetical protein